MRLAACLLSMTGALVAAGAAADGLDQVGVEFSYDDNLTRAQLARDIKSDSALAVSAAGGPRFQITGRDSLALTASLAATAYGHYRDLDNVSAGLALTYRRKLGLGPYVPQLSLSGSATRLEYRSDLRDGWLYGVEAEASRRFSERLALRAAYRYEQRDADRTPARLLAFIPADVFDLKSRSLGVSGDFTVLPRYVLSLGYTVHKGDIVSTTQRNLPIFLASSAIAPDPVFGGNTYAYKMQALTRAVSLGLSREMGRQASLSLGWEHRDSHAEGGIDYRSNLVRATYLYGF